MLALPTLTHAVYPAGAPFARSDGLAFAALFVQAPGLSFGLETFEEAKVIFLFHRVESRGGRWPRGLAWFCPA